MTQVQGRYAVGFEDGGKACTKVASTSCKRQESSLSPRLQKERGRASASSIAWQDRHGTCNLHK